MLNQPTSAPRLKTDAAVHDAAIGENRRRCKNQQASRTFFLTWPTLITATVTAFVLMMRTDRRAAAPLLPSDAFSLWSRTGAGLWMILLMSVGYSPLAIYAPLFLQRLHGVSPVGAGYMVALASLAWTIAALAVASLSEEWPPRFIIMGPAAMGAGLAGVGLLMAPGPVTALILPIILI
jgi:hypothetical protein